MAQVSRRSHSPRRPRPRLTPLSRRSDPTEAAPAPALTPLWPRSSTSPPGLWSLFCFGVWNTVALERGGRAAQRQERNAGGQWREPVPAPNLRVTLEAPSERVSARPLQPAGASGCKARRGGQEAGVGGGEEARVPGSSRELRATGAAGSHSLGSQATVLPPPQEAAATPLDPSGNLRLGTRARGRRGSRGQRAGECLASCRGEVAARLRSSNSLPRADASAPRPPPPPPPTPDS